jgi:hypothetical protein
MADAYWQEKNVKFKLFTTQLAMRMALILSEVLAQSPKSRDFSESKQAKQEPINIK